MCKEIITEFIEARRIFREAEEKLEMSVIEKVKKAIREAGTPDDQISVSQIEMCGDRLVINVGSVKYEGAWFDAHNCPGFIVSSVKRIFERAIEDVLQIGPEYKFFLAIP